MLSDEFAVVGIGASAGGLEALEKFLRAMPVDSGMAFAFVLHLDPTHESHLVELLRKCTAMPMCEVSDGMGVKANHVYVIPPGAYLSISDKTLHLSEPVERRGLRLPIDFFFRALAAEQQQRAIAMVFSGSGSDGSLGVKEIKEHGGLVIVEDPQAAQFDGMPRAAIATGTVDHVLPLEEIPRVLTSYVSHSYVNPVVSAGSQPDSNYQQTIIAWLRANTRFDFGGYKPGTLNRRIQRRMGLHHLEKPEEYLRLLRQSAEEGPALVKDLLISVTNFFRDPEAWQSLAEDTIRPLVARKSDHGPIRAWVPACATGEEAYSIAMLMAEQLQAAKSRCDVQIFASDVDVDALSIARAGLYPENIVADVSPDRLNRFFVKGEHTYRISKEIRDSVVFAEQNVLADPPFARLDLISCRNLLIYLDPDVQKRMIRLFHFALNENGHLLLGNSETIGRDLDLFQPVCKKWRIYRRVGSVRHERLDFPITPRTVTAEVRIKPDRQLPAGSLRLGQFVQHLVNERYSPACALISRRSEVLFLQGPVDRYLKLPTGELAADLFGMAREGLRAKLRSLVRAATTARQICTDTALRVKIEGTYRPVEITAEPIVSSPEYEGLLLVTFRDLPQPENGQRRVDTGSGGAQATDVKFRRGEESVLLQQLEEELQFTREELQSTIEQQETSAEEMKAANEEVTSVNEELQSTNEELETSKEELQSLNEELTTVNNQLEAKIAELEAISNDLQNLLSSADTATIFLDRSFCIKRFTPATTQLLRLIPTDLGRPIGDVVQNVVDQHLLADAEQVLRDLTPIQREVSTNDDGGAAHRPIQGAGKRCFLRRLLPYRTEDDRIEGVVITFTDVTEIKQLTVRLRAARDYAESIVETIREPLLVLDSELRVRSANLAFYSTFSTLREAIAGKRIYELAGGQWDIPELRKSLEEVLSENLDFRDLEVSRDYVGLGWRRMLLNARAVLDSTGKPELILLAFEDVTDRFQRQTAALALREQERIGRELHDSLGQQTTAISMLAARLHRQLESESHPEAGRAQKLLECIEQAKADVRVLSRGLLPVELDAQGLMSALAELIECTGESHGISCRFECPGEVTLDDSFVATHLFLIAKEAVHNAVKHAKATKIEVSLDWADETLTLQIRDNGVGILGKPSETGGLGIRIMRYRAELIGGNFAIKPAIPSGTIVSCLVLEKEIRNGQG